MTRDNRKALTAMLEDRLPDTFRVEQQYGISWMCVRSAPPKSIALVYIEPDRSFWCPPIDDFGALRTFSYTGAGWCRRLVDDIVTAMEIVS